MGDSTKETNPKDAVAGDKLPLHLWPETATAMGCLALLDGALKYGRTNWRAAGVRYSVYVDALRRHVGALFEGEDYDRDSGLPHEAHALACLAILVDARAARKLVDDRQYPGGHRRLMDELTPEVRRLKTLRAAESRSPRHFTIRDRPPTEEPDRDMVLHVVVGVLVDRRGRVFFQSRSLGDESFPGALECPGGGVQAGESDHAALARELREEIGIELGALTRPFPLWSGRITGYRGATHEFRFYLVLADDWAGKIRLIDGQSGHAWVDPQRTPRGPIGMTPANQLAWPTICDALGVLRKPSK